MVINLSFSEKNSSIIGIESGIDTLVKSEITSKLTKQLLDSRFIFEFKLTN